MSDSYDKAIDDLNREIKARMRMVNDFLNLQGKPPLYPDPDGATASRSTYIRRDQFYTYGLSTAVREFLNMRKDVGPATLDEIYDALVQGSFKFDADEANAKPALKQSLTKNTAIFHRLPNATYGLAEWYPGRKNGDEEAVQTKKRKAQVAKPTVPAKKAKEPSPLKAAGKPPKAASAHSTEADSDKKPSLLGAVKEGIRSFEAPFTKQELVNWINDRYPHFHAVSPSRRTSIFSMVAHVREEMSLRVVKEGRGREPSVYQVAPSSMNGNQQN